MELIIKLFLSLSSSTLTPFSVYHKILFQCVEHFSWNFYASETLLELCSCQQVLILHKMWLDWPKLRTSNHRTSAVGPLQKKKSKVKSSLLTSLIANIIIGAITGTLILDSTRSALPRISWLGSWERRQQILNLTSCICCS